MATAGNILNLRLVKCQTLGEMARVRNKFKTFMGEAVKNEGAGTGARDRKRKTRHTYAWSGVSVILKKDLGNEVIRAGEGEPDMYSCTHCFSFRYA